VRTVVLGGIASELTVDSTVRTLNDRGHECLVLTDGCAPLVASLGARAHHSLTMSGGIFGALGSVDHVADALVSSPSDQQFAPTARSSS
jgi:nicotinamidase-related amidase